MVNNGNEAQASTDVEVMDKAPFKLIRQSLAESGLFPSGLAGACFASAFLSDFVLKKNGFESEVVANNRHCFNRFFVEGVPYILDLTATQISKDRFEEVSILPEREAKARLTPFKRTFYKDDLVFTSSNDLLFPREGEDLKVADELVQKLSGLLKEETLLSEFRGIESLDELKTFADTFVDRLGKHVSQVVAQPEQKRVRKHSASMEFGSP